MKNNAPTLPPDEVERRIFGKPLTDLNRPQPPLSAGAKEARMLMEKARLAQEAQLKEKQMPDLKTELTKVINQWTNQEEQAIMQITQPEQPTNTAPTPAPAANATRATFEYIRDNEGVNRDTLTKALTLRGFKPRSVSSLCAQMVKQRLVREVGGGLFVNQQEYAPLRSSKLFLGKRKPKAVAKPVRKAKPRVKVQATPSPEWAFTPPALLPMPLVKPVPAPAEWSVESVVGSLNVRQAMAVYDELRKIFGA